MKAVPSEVIEELAQYDSPTICNVIELCHYRPCCSGNLSHDIRAIYPALPPVVGHAVTATFRSAQPASPEETKVNLYAQKAVFDAVPGPKIMVIQDLDEPKQGAVYGEIISHVLKAFGCLGLITNGFARDILQVGELNFSCFASGISVSHGNNRITSIGEPVNVGGVTIRPGDLLHGDANGVTTIPHEIAGAVAESCKPFVEAEEVLINAATSGVIARGEYESPLAEFRKRLDDIARKLSGKRTDQKALA